MKRNLGITLTYSNLMKNACSFYLEHEAELHAAFGWVETTKNAYKKYILMLQPYLKGTSLLVSTVDAYSKAIELLNRDRTKKYKENTLNTIRSVIKDICYFIDVYYNADDFQNPFWGTTWNANRETNNSIQPKETEQERLTKKLKLPKSLTMLEEFKLSRVIKDTALSNTYAMGMAIMFYMGLRPGECAGLTYGDIRQLRVYPEVNCLYVYTQIRTTGEKTNALKTENAYRVLPIPKELNDLLAASRDQVEKNAGDPANYPIVTKNGALYTDECCDPNEFAKYCKKVLRNVHVKEDVVIDAAREARSDGEGESAATSYLLRRNFATSLLAVCCMEADEIKYLLGHAIETIYEKRRYYLNPDTLYHLWQKENLRSFFTAPKKEFTIDAHALSVQQKSAFISVPDAYIKKHPEGVLLHIYNTDVNDRIKIIVQEGTAKSISMLSSNQYVPQKRAERVNIRAEYAEAMRKTKNRSKEKEGD